MTPNDVMSIFLWVNENDNPAQIARDIALFAGQVLSSEVEIVEGNTVVIPLNVADTVSDETLSNALAKGINARFKYTPLRYRFQRPAKIVLPPARPIPKYLYPAEVLYDLRLRDVLGRPATHPTLAPTGLVLRGTSVAIFEEHTELGGWKDRVSITEDGLNIWTGTGDVRGPSLRKL